MLLQLSPLPACSHELERTSVFRRREVSPLGTRERICVTAETALQSPTPMRRLGQWAPIRVICYVAAILAVAAVAKLLTHLFVPPLPSPLHAPLTLVRNLLLPIAMFAVYALLVRVIERRVASELDIRKGLVTLPT